MLLYDNSNADMENPWACNADFNKLPNRIDWRTIKFVEFPEVEVEYPDDWIGRIRICKAQEKANAGVLGQYVNLLMAWQAMSITPNVLIRLEEIIDATVKTGVPLIHYRNWINEQLKELTKVPRHLADRFKKRLEQVETEFDFIQDTALKEVAEFEKALLLLEQECVPPQQLVDEAEQYVEQGKTVRQAYNIGAKDGVEYARQLTEDVVVGNVKKNLLGAMYYGWTAFRHHPENLWDAPLWLLGKKLNKGREQGIANMWIEVLRDIGLVAEPVSLDDGKLVWYQKPEPVKVSDARVILLNGVWFNMARAAGEEYASMSAMPVERRTFWKSQVGNWLSGARDEIMKLTREVVFSFRDDGRIVALDQNGKLVGYVDKRMISQIIAGNAYVIIGGTSDKEGNATVQVSQI